MVTVQHNPVNEEHFPHPRPIAQELHAYDHILYRVLRLMSSDFSALQYSLFYDALESHQLFFFYIEPTPQPMHPIRSRRKMLHREIKAKQLLREEVWEEELQTSEGYSLLSAAIQGNRENIPYLIERQRLARYAFGCILPQQMAFSPAELLLELPGYLRPNSKLTRVDIPKLLQYCSAKQAHLFHLPFDANDKLQFSLFAHRQDAVFADILSAIDEEYTLPQSN